MSAAVLFIVAQAFLCVAIVGLIVHARRGARLVAGLRADLTAHGSALASVAQEAHARIGGTQHLAIQALDRLLYYTKHSAIMTRLGAKYDAEIAKLRSNAATPAPVAPAAAAPADLPVAETTDDDTAKIVGSIGAAATPAGTPCG